jgi:hypothetical protein
MDGQTNDRMNEQTERQAVRKTQVDRIKEQTDRQKKG